MKKRQLRNQVLQQSLVPSLNGSENNLKAKATSYFENRFFFQKLSTISDINEVVFTISGLADIKRPKEQVALFTRWFTTITLTQPSDFTFTVNASKPKRAGQRSKLHEIRLKSSHELGQSFLLGWRYFLRKCFTGLTKNTTESYRMSPFSVSAATRYFGLHQLSMAVSGVASTDPFLQLTIYAAATPDNHVKACSRVLPKNLKQTAKARLSCLLSKYKI